MRRRLATLLSHVCTTLATATLGVIPAFGQVPQSEIEALKTEIRRLQERLERLERSVQPAPPPAPTPTAPAPPAVAAPPAPPAPPPAVLPPAVAREGEREITLGKEHIFQTIGIPKPEILGTRISGFFVGSASYNSHVQMVPEFAGGGPALADPGRLNFRFDKFGLGVSRQFAEWLSVGAAIEVESHRDRHTHGFDPAFGCPRQNGQLCVEQFGAEDAETEVVLDKFNITVVAPLGNGLSLSFGRFDVPFGIERHDEVLNLTATTSEIFQFGRPNKMTGFLAAYQFTPWLDVTGWLVNRWEAETTHDPFDDNNRAKSIGGRIGFTPLHGRQLLNFGVGGWFGPEQREDTANNRWVVDVDVTWSPIRRLLLAAEAIWGGEDRVSLRQRGIPFPERGGEVDARWWGFYLLAHYDLYDWLGLSFRYGLIDDKDGARTGVTQTLQSWTFAPIFHLSRLIRDLRPTGATFARTRHYIDWVDVKLEYRFNHSDKPVFSDAAPAVPIRGADHSSHQLQLQFVINF
jgi:hypothetical protein